MRGEPGVDAALPSLIPLRCKGCLKAADQGGRMLFLNPSAEPLYVQQSHQAA